MEDAQSDPQFGRTDWRRFAVAVGVPALVAGGLVIALANGALAASFSVSGTQFKLTADRLEGKGFTQYSKKLPTEQVQKSTGEKYVVAAMSGIKSADIHKLCQSVAAGPVVLRIEAGTDPDKPAQAEDLLIGMSELSGDATFGNIDIGQDASTLDADGQKQHGEAGAFGQQATDVTIVGLKQKAYMTSASTFKLTGMSLKLFLGDSGKECYQG
ncbi:DUF6230 family protein [Paractinoplanes brasiliensis]|uniref:Cholesterol esterase n=1 Tax=Paractinoplanes brasiliensis TaxID=52695 RepID=A0A4R6K2G5_9ACTN|nr:DUF6230 family protein [Actinoplanes brasiliensis]TDO42512.1 hypothetical protein C8E87_6285 [Actinoplanes brasiliensis]GID31384.1 cholesterol esterase [Actinoplanes brasiliensis]